MQCLRSSPRLRLQTCETKLSNDPWVLVQVRTESNPPLSYLSEIWRLNESVTFVIHTKVARPAYSWVDEFGGMFENAEDFASASNQTVSVVTTIIKNTCISPPAKTNHMYVSYVFWLATDIQEHIPYHSWYEICTMSFTRRFRPSLRER